MASFITALTLTGLKINNGSGTFKVDENGNVVANKLSSKSATITGGSINIQTSSQNTSAIQLSHNEWTLKISPSEIRIDNSTIGGHVVLQADAMDCYWNDELKVNIDSNSGNIITYTDNGKQVFAMNTAERSFTICDENNKPTVVCLGRTGEIYCKSISTENHTLD